MENRPAFRPSFLIGLNMIPLNADVTLVAHQLFVNNFNSLPLLLDGMVNQIRCMDLIGILVSRSVTTLSKLNILLLVFCDPND